MCVVRPAVILVALAFAGSSCGGATAARDQAPRAHASDEDELRAEIEGLWRAIASFARDRAPLERGPPPRVAPVLPTAVECDPLAGHAGAGHAPADCDEPCADADALCELTAALCNRSAKLDGDRRAERRCADARARCREQRARCCTCGRPQPRPLLL
jgi:hypothetical protein